MLPSSIRHRRHRRHRRHWRRRLHAVQASSGATGSARPGSGPPVGATTNADLDAVTRTRRLFFNQAPTVAPVQITGRLTGPVTGTVGAVDPEGDQLAYRITRAPREGAVQLNADGTYTYTPDSDFDGVDTFRVLAIDLGPHINLFRPRGTRATALVNQGAIKFDFNYTDGGTGWTAERQQALQRAANDLVEYFLVTSPVTLTYDVGLDDNEGDLASAGSDLINGNRGYWRTVVQNKLLPELIRTAQRPTASSTGTSSIRGRSATPSAPTTTTSCRRPCTSCCTLSGSCRMWGRRATTRTPPGPFSPASS